MVPNIPVLIAMISMYTALLVLVVVLVLFGANRLPELFRSLGRSVTEFKKGVSEAGSDDEEPPKKVDKA
jgi:TatA/E family protein of Tat protein translocase